MNKSLIEYIEGNSLWFYAPESYFYYNNRRATFLDLVGYYRQWAEKHGYYLMIDLCNKGKGIVEFYADLYWMAKDGILDDDNDDKRLETKGMFKAYEEAFMPALNKVMELVVE